MSLDIIVQFVERKISSEEFLENLYYNEELKLILSEDIELSTYKGNDLRIFLCSHGHIYDHINILEEFLEKKGMNFKKTTTKVFDIKLFDLIVNFVERKMSPEEFLESLKYNEDLKELLSGETRITKYITGDLYLYLMNQKLNMPSGLLNALEALEYFLGNNGVNFKKNDEAEQLHSLMLDIQPNWTDISNEYFQKILEKANDRKGADLKKFLKEEIKKDFRCMKKPPRWLQSPQWLFEDDRPLIFVGQIDISDIRHDTSQLYVFLDELNNQFYFTEQST